uniref:Uncharacterized protein n=1 Tax=Arundo donax TaxID=35708 RepID=A0A0A8Y976_ARUDO
MMSRTDIALLWYWFKTNLIHMIFEYTIKWC